MTEKFKGTCYIKKVSKFVVLTIIFSSHKIHGPLHFRFKMSMFGPSGTKKGKETTDHPMRTGVFGPGTDDVYWEGVVSGTGGPGPTDVEVVA